jgi:hypothetical protein
LAYSRKNPQRRGGSQGLPSYPKLGLDAVH